MKFVVFAFVVSFSVAATAATKICFGTGDDPSGHFIAKVGPTNLTVGRATGNGAVWEGTFPRNGANVSGKDGKTYLKYYSKGDEGCNTVLADENLLYKGTKGWIKFRCRGEGFGDSKYFCRDSSR